MDNWDDLRLFLAVARTGSLSGAARRLGSSQPTLGRRIAALEDRLGLSLFVRTGRGLELSEAGAEMMQDAEQMEAAAADIAARAGGRRQAMEGTVSISMVDSLAQGWFAPAAVAFRRLHPGIALEVLVDLQAADLLRRQADMALRMFRPTQTRLIAKKVTELGWGFFAARHYLDRHGAPATRADLARHPMVLPEESLARMMAPLITLIQDLPADIAVRSNSPAALVAATRAGHGIGFHSCLLAEAHPDLVRMLPDWTVARTDLWLVAHEDLRHVARMRTLFDFLADAIAADRARFAGLSSTGG